MALFVQKYGGTSVGDAECMRRVAGRIRECRDDGHSVVVVVSAMGKTTDKLIELALEVNPEPDEREMDVLMSTGEQISVAVLAMALHAQGVDAVSMSGPQAGIVTDDVHAKAKIMDVRPERIRASLDAGRVVIVAGFQGLNSRDDIATLGRGGSDTTAVAIAAGLKADRCQIFTDVDGVYTTDPRVVPDARKLDEIGYDEMLELASLGARVLQSRSVEFARNHGVVLEVLSSFKNVPGTIIKEEVEAMEDIVVRGVAADTEQAKVTLQRVPDCPGVAARIFQAVAGANVNVDMIVQNVSEAGFADISFTIPLVDMAAARKVMESNADSSQAKEIVYDESMAKVSIVGVGMRSHSGVAHTMFKTLADNGINIEMISTSEIKISVVIDKEQSDAAVQVLHAAFGLA